MKRPANETVLNLIALALLVAGGVWLMYATEWVDIWRPMPPRGEAARDDHHAIKQIATRLGARVVSPDGLERMPPPGATLVLQSSAWDFLPGRNELLRQWVQDQGGHLVLPSYYATRGDIAWVPVRERKQPRRAGADGKDDEDDDEEEQAADSQTTQQAAPKDKSRENPFDPTRVGPLNNTQQQCPSLVEGGTARVTAAPRRFRLCSAKWAARLQTLPGEHPSWSIEDARGAHTLRVPVGRGRVTTMAEYRFLSNHNLFRGDHAQAAISALDLRAGDEIWFVTDEKREALLLWLWHRAGPAIGLALLALALALWRNALRFGPLLPRAAPARRSVAEQIRGTAAFVLRIGGAPLLVAARRALDEVARRRVAGYDRMTMGERIEALRHPTGLTTEALTRALDPQMPPRRGRALADKLALIEQARRRLAFNTP